MKPPSVGLIKYMHGYLQRSKKVVRLFGWEIEFNPVPMDDEESPGFAEIFVSKDRNFASIQIGSKFFDDPEGSICHELIHCWTIRITQCVDRVLKHKLIDSDVATVIEVTDHPMEICTDELALALRPLMPKWDGPTA